MFQNCSEIDLVPLKIDSVDIGSTDGTVITPPSPSVSKTRKIIACKSESVSGQAKYFADVIDLASGTIETTAEVGNCRSLLVADLNGDGNQEWVNTNWNSTVNPCVLQVYDAKTNALNYERVAPGTVVFSTSITMCTGDLKLYSSPNTGDRLLYSYEVGAVSQQGYQILAGPQLITEFDERYQYHSSMYTFSLTKDINGDGKPEAWSYIPGSFDNINGYRDNAFAFLDGSIPYNNVIQSFPLPDNNLPISGHALHHPNLPSKHILSIDVQEMIPYIGGGLINSPKNVIIKLYSNTMQVEQTLTVSNVLSGDLKFQYLYQGKADFNGDSRDDAVFSQATGQYSQYTEIRSGEDLSVIVKVDKQWLAPKINNQNISEQIVYMGSIDFNDDDKHEIVLKYHSFTTNKANLIIVGVDGTIYFEKELSSWPYSNVYGLKYLID